MMDSITIENFRCFRERQTVPLAPLTLLVGENSTGKTSFLALIRALSDLAFDGRAPNFKAPPYDLGSFDEIAHHRGGRGSRAESFTAGASIRLHSPFTETDEFEAIDLEVRFCKGRDGTAPAPTRQSLKANGAWIDERIDQPNTTYTAKIGTDRGTWEVCLPTDSRFPTDLGSYRFYVLSHKRRAEIALDGEAPPKWSPVRGSPAFSEDDEGVLRVLWSVGAGLQRLLPPELLQAEPFAGAPVRSQPHRTYDPVRWERVPEGDHVPMRIAELSGQQTRRWNSLKKQLEKFGEAAGLFDEITVRHLGATGSDPFQIQVRKGSKRLKGPFRNLIDVGYGVSQALPIVTELIEASTPTDLYLLQQPEVHLHPSAQAELGTLMCNVAADGRQLIVETHSDHLMDRVRMDVRDGTTDLKPEDVSLLYFERTGLDVCIHPIRFDKLGNVLDAPPGYRQFFLKEINRSLGL